MEDQQEDELRRLEAAWKADKTPENRQAVKDACSYCQQPGMKPGHFGSVGCKSHGLAAGGNRHHCTCDTCF